MLINRKSFFIICLSFILIYLSLWLINFKYVYGWIMDDQYYFDRGVGVYTNIEYLFFRFNYTHLNHLIFGTLPIILDINIPSLNIPNIEEKT